MPSARTTSPASAPANAATAPAGAAGPAPPRRHAFDYAIVRVVPRVERDEFVNAGVIVHCPTLAYLAAGVELDRGRLAALAPELDGEEIDEIARHLACIPAICDGGPAAGQLGALPASARFNWLVAPYSHVVQVSPVHAGICDDPARALEHLLDTMVRAPAARATPAARAAEATTEAGAAEATREARTAQRALASAAAPGEPPADAGQPAGE
jgi:hypothetical protein